MPRDRNFTNFQHEGTYNWRDAVNSGKGSGVLTVSPCKEMLAPGGYKREVGNKSSGTYISAIYDESFVRDFIHKKIVVALEFMSNDVFKADEFMDFMSKQVDYSLQEIKRTSESQVIKDARELAAKYGHDVDHWLNILRQGLADKNDNQKSSDNKPSSSNTSREKVKA